MPLRSENTRILVGLLGSALLHGAIILPLLILVMAAPARPKTVEGQFDPADLQANVPPPDPRDPLLGINARTPSTFTWIGHEEYEEHMAALADVEQAAFDNAPAAPAVTEEAFDAETPVPDPKPNVAPAPNESPGETVEPEATAQTPATPAAASEPLVVLPTREPAPLPIPAPEPEDDAPAPPKPVEPKPVVEKPAPEVGTPKKPQETPSTEKPQGPTAPPAQEPADGDPADKQSDATSIIDVPLDKIKRGKPIARPGLELKPQRPHVTTLMSLTSAPCNPLVRISFGRDGRPKKKAVVLRTSCDTRVDHAIELSLYRWRASGSQLSELEGEETLDVELVIVLNSRRRGR